MIDDIERLRIRNAEARTAYKRLDVKSVCCALCGEDDPHCFERDHIGGKNHSDLLYTLCKSCHAKRTSRQRTEHPQIGPDPKNDFEVAARILLGVSDFLEFIVERLREIVDLLLRQAKRGITDIKD